MAEYRDHAQQCCQGLGLKADATSEVLRLVETRYQEPHRAYHTLDHLNHMFRLFEQNRSKLLSPHAVALAILFHDIVYDPTSSTNEEDSAELLRKAWSSLVVSASDDDDETSSGNSDPTLLNKVTEWILATKAHDARAAEGDTDLAYLLDFDMAILGSPHHDYATYAARVRLEFQHVPEALYCERRASFLEALAHDNPGKPIYATESFRATYEARARENVRWEAARLRSGHVITATYAVPRVMPLLINTHEERTRI